jgi:hypothetical protein
MIAIRIPILPFCILLLNCVIGNASSTDQNNLKTAHDFYLGGNRFCHHGKSAIQEGHSGIHIVRK